MGVKGLSSFLQENKRRLSRTFDLNAEFVDRTILVIDGWSFIYNLFSDISLPWIYGGEYAEFSSLIVLIVKAWLSVGLKLHFVFDGPIPEAKFATAVSRRNQSQVQSCQLFFRTSSASRSTIRFLNDIRLLPPLAGSVCIETLLGLQIGQPDLINLHFADEEGDPYAVELAGRVGAYVVGQDSDYVIFNSRGYQGYIPLEEMIWISSVQEDLQSQNSNDEDYQVVQKKKKKSMVGGGLSYGRGLVPPSIDQTLTLSVTVYTPSALSEFLNLPVAILPLLSAVVGNDFTLYPTDSITTGFAQPSLFDGRLTSSQRITHSAGILASLIKPLSGYVTRKRRQKVPQSVIELISMTVATLTATRNLTSYDQEQIVTRIVEATLPYAITEVPMSESEEVLLWPTDLCALHEPSSCPILSWISGSSSDISSTSERQRASVRSLYIQSYRCGKLNRRLTDLLSSGTFWPELFLENPDMENVARSVGREIRILIYSLLDNALGLPRQEKPGSQPSLPEIAHDAEDPDEIIDVIEDDSDEDSDPDYISRLRDVLQDLQIENNNTAKYEDVLNQSGDSSDKKRQEYSEEVIVTEYVRKGSRVVGEEVEVPQLSSLLSNHLLADAAEKEAISSSVSNVPLQLQPADLRFTVCLRHLGSDYPSVRHLSSIHLMSILSIRWVVSRMQMRSIGSSRERLQERWTRREVQAFLCSFLFSGSVNQMSESQNVKTLPNSSVSSISERTPVLERSLQLTAQVSTAMESIEYLVQALLITDLVPSNAQYFSGELFHSLLCGSRQMNSLSADIWAAATEHLGDFLADEPMSTRKARKTRKEGGNAREPANIKRGKKGIYHWQLLADIDQDH